MSFTVTRAAHIFLFLHSYEVVSDGRWHRIEVITLKQNFTLKVNDGLPRSIVNDGSREYLETDSPLYLGGLPREVAGKAVKSWHIRDTDSFRGEGQAVVLYP